MTALVVDASVTVAWFLRSRATVATDALLERVVRDEALTAPTLWPYEVSSALRKAERRGKLAAAQGREREALLRRLVHLAEIEPFARRTFFGMLALAERHDLSPYDAAWLDLALRRGLPLATLDRALRAAAGREGVAVLPAEAGAA